MQCPHCIVTTSKASMKTHLIKHHSARLPHECPECSYRAVTMNGIKNHASRWHNGSWERNKWLAGKARKACSNGCGKTYTQGYSMNRHIKYDCPLTKDKPTEKKTQNKDKLKECVTKYNDLIMKYTNAGVLGELRYSNEDT